ncbi:Thiol-disulfide isomerase or thioredoxin [Nitrosospira multiformis]|uniref:Thiol-disulfide isomerase or thioredoxin n=1 Tax=Nitrosospira multiformis TaxID=1231 RepID=A0A1H8D8N9_9PROT|nr:TlpA disulfide reductase family protein [Nitrosospira multiformis]SEN03525.1 Thiol-disulfide isomerase or thioredoxin [Nitrosospira multiformis]
MKRRHMKRCHLSILLYRFCLCVMLSAVPVAQTYGFTFTDHTGKKLSLSDFKGKWVLVNFWATWCPPCLKEIPDLVSLYESRKKDIMVIGVAMDYRNPDVVLKHAKRLSVTYPIVLGDQELARQVGPVSMLPTTYVFDPEGKPAVYKIGIVSREALEEFMRENSNKIPNSQPAGKAQQKGR